MGANGRAGTPTSRRMASTSPRRGLGASASAAAPAASASDAMASSAPGAGSSFAAAGKEGSVCQRRCSEVLRNGDVRTPRKPSAGRATAVTALTCCSPQVLLQGDGELQGSCAAQGPGLRAQRGQGGAHEGCREGRGGQMGERVERTSHEGGRGATGDGTRHICSSGGEDVICVDTCRCRAGREVEGGHALQG